MFHSYYEKLFLFCVSLVTMAGTAAAERVVDPYRPATTPIISTTPKVQANPAGTVTNSLLEAYFRKLDRKLEVRPEQNGTTRYFFEIRDSSGAVIPMIVTAGSNKLHVTAVVGSSFIPNRPLAEINRDLDNAKQPLPSRIVALPIGTDGHAILVAFTVIERPVSMSQLVERLKQTSGAAASLMAMRKAGH